MAPKRRIATELGSGVESHRSFHHSGFIHLIFDHHDHPWFFFISAWINKVIADRPITQGPPAEMLDMPSLTLQPTCVHTRAKRERKSQRCIFTIQWHVCRNISNIFNQMLQIPIPTAIFSILHTSVRRGGCLWGSAIADLDLLQAQGYWYPKLHVLHLQVCSMFHFGRSWKH